MSTQDTSNGTIEVRKEVPRSLDEIVGLLGKPARSATVEEMDRAIAARFRVESGVALTSDHKLLRHAGCERP
jgi:hypothetical protein